MTVCHVLIDSVEKALDFNKIITSYDFDVDLVNGHTYVDAKSLVGIFSLPLYKPLELIVHSDELEAENLEEELKPYRIEQIKISR